MISISYDVVETAIKHFRKELNAYKTAVKTALFNLSNDPILDPVQVDYINEIRGHLNAIITGKPEKLENLKNNFEGIIPATIMADKANKEFRDQLLDCLGYTKRRSDFYPRYFNKIGIKACIYCNSQLTVSVTSIKRDVIARFQVDHYIPKSSYPCFSISLYNLYPSCASCNNLKSAHDIYFVLYKKVADMSSAFQFLLDKTSVIKYWKTKNPDDLVFKFNEPPLPAGYTKTFKEVFHVQGIYDTQKDILEELVQKSEVYTQTYKNRLMKEFPTVFTNPTIVNRLLVGNYVSEEHIHRRPMAKFMIDISKQVGLI